MSHSISWLVSSKTMTFVLSCSSEFRLVKSGGLRQHNSIVSRSRNAVTWLTQEQAFSEYELSQSAAVNSQHRLKVRRIVSDGCYTCLLYDRGRIAAVCRTE